MGPNEWDVSHHFPNKVERRLSCRQSLSSRRPGLLWKGLATGPEGVLMWESQEMIFSIFQKKKKIQSFYNMTTQAYAHFALTTYFCKGRQITHSVEWKGMRAFLRVWSTCRKLVLEIVMFLSIPQQCSKDESLRCAFWCCLIKELAISNITLKGESSPG